MSEMVGKRRRANTKPWNLQPGDYMVRKGHVWVCTPNGAGPLDITAWEITEHTDGTITVSPSIEAHATPVSPYWHGHLRQGVWSGA